MYIYVLEQIHISHMMLYCQQKHALAVSHNNNNNNNNNNNTDTSLFCHEVVTEEVFLQY